MKDVPILFSAPMVRALIAGTKTQTRRLAAPRWAVGDNLWVRENFRLDVAYDALKPTAAPAEAAVFYEAGGQLGGGAKGKQHPSIHLPRRWSRIDLLVTGLRSEPLQDISEADAIAEGITRIGAGYASFPEGWSTGPNFWTVDCGDGALSAPTARGVYRMLWDIINGEGAWEANPLVYATDFSVTRNATKAG